jgi:hypothetical protein
MLLSHWGQAKGVRELLCGFLSPVSAKMLLRMRVKARNITYVLLSCLFSLF